MIKRLLIAALFLCMGSLCQAGKNVSISYDQDNAMHGFGVRDLTQALEETGYRVVGNDPDFHIVFSSY